MGNMIHVLGIVSIGAMLAMAAAAWLARADRTARSVLDVFWDEGRGLIADDAAHTRYSEHAQCLALLADVLPPDRAARAFKGLVEAPDLARTTVYFSHYLFDTFLKHGRADLFLKRLDLWRGFVRDGMKTPLEAPGWRGRSECHAWGAHPLYHLQTGVAGIRPATDGFSSVLVAPQPGPLKWIRAVAPTPKGKVAIDLRFRDGGAYGSVVLPPGLKGDFLWRGVARPLVAGMNEFPDPALAGVPRAATPLCYIGMQHISGLASDWWEQRHESKIGELASHGGKIDLVMLGDSITHDWEGARGPGSDFGGRRLAEWRRRFSVVDLGYGGDTTRNVLWRIENGELDGYEAKRVMLMNAPGSDPFGGTPRKLGRTY